MRIALVTDTCAPSVGGVQTFLQGVCAAWVARGHRLSLVAGPGHVSPHPDVELIGALPLGAPRDQGELRAMGGAIADAVRMARADVVMLVTAGLALYRAHVPAPCVVVVHGKDLTAPWQRVPGTPDPSAARGAIARAVEACERRVFVSDATRRCAMDLGVLGPSDVVPPGFDLAFFSPGPSARARLALREDDFVVATLSRLTARKGHRTVLDALSRTQLERAVLCVIGDGDERAALEAHARARGVDARFLGMCARTTVRDLLRSADVHVLAPQRLTGPAGDDVEGYGLSALEAAACGTPSIGTRSGGVVEAIVHDDSGLLVEEGDDAALAASLTRIAREPDLRARLARGARRRALLHGGHEATADRLEAVLAIVLARARAGAAA